MAQKIGSSQKNERELVKQMQAGDREAFARFVDDFGPTVHRLSRRYARTEADAEDLTQEIFVAVCQSIGSFRGDAALTTWVHRVALNHCMKHGAKQAARPQTVPYDDLPLTGEPSPSTDPSASAIQSELKGRVDVALSALSVSHRDVVVLHEMQGLTYAEIAEVLDVPVGTVKSRLFHAFGKLREKLGGYVKGDEDGLRPRSASPAAAAPLCMAAASAATLKGDAR